MAKGEARILAERLADADGSGDSRAVLERARREAREHPTAVLPYLDVLVDLLDHPTAEVRAGAAKVLEAVAAGTAGLDRPRVVLATVLAGEADADAGPGTGSDTDAGPGTDRRPGTGTTAGVGGEAGTDTGTGVGTDRDTGITDPDTGIDDVGGADATGVGTGAGTGSGAGADVDVDALARPYFEVLAGRFLEETERPAVRVATAESLASLSAVAPGAVPGLVTELLDLAVPRTTPGDLRVPALEAVRNVAVEDPRALRGERIRITGLFGDRDPTVRNLALDIAVRIAEDGPVTGGALGPHVDRLVAIAATDDHPDNRSAAAGALARVAEDDPGRLAGRVDELVALLSDDEPGVVRSAVEALLGLARGDPESVADHLDRLSELRTADDPRTREVASEALAVVGAALPGATAEVLEDALADFPNGSERARRSAARVLYHLADEDPAALWNRVGSVRNGLRSNDPVVRRGAVTTLARIGEQHPEAIPDYASAYVPLLDDDSERTRAGAASALAAAAIADGDVAPAATDLADRLDDDSPAVRTAAARALVAIGLREPDAIAPARVALDDVVEPVDAAELPDGTPIEQGIAALRDVTD